MRYALMIYAQPGYAEALPEAEWEAVQTEYEALTVDPRCIGAVRLRPAGSAVGVHVTADGRRVVTDGPFADTKEVLGGLYLVEVADREEALAMAARVPAARLGGIVEVRPLEEG